MTHAAVAADLDETLDVHSGLTPEVALYLEVLIDVFPEKIDIVLGKIPYANVGINAGFRQDLLGSGETDTVDVGKTDFNTLVPGQIYATNTCH